MIKLRNISKNFTVGEERIAILDQVDLAVGQGEKVAIVGPSGSGKTTLLSLIAGLDMPDAGTVTVAGTRIDRLGERELARFRNETIGIIFQSFELITPFTALENVMTPLDIAGRRESVGAARDWIQAVNLENRSGALPLTLSGGEKQRVAIARSLVMRPQVVLADEPTGSLDRVTGAKIIDLLIAAVEKSGATLLVITHDTSISSRMDRVFELRDRRLYASA